MSSEIQFRSLVYHSREGYSFLSDFCFAYQNFLDLYNVKMWHLKCFIKDVKRFCRLLFLINKSCAYKAWINKFILLFCIHTNNNITKCYKEFSEIAASYISKLHTIKLFVYMCVYIPIPKINLFTYCLFRF